MPAISLSVGIQGLPEVVFGEGGPRGIAEVQFAEGGLSGHEAGQTLLAGGADDEVDLGLASRGQVALHSSFIDGGRLCRAVALLFEEGAPDGSANSSL